MTHRLSLAIATLALLAAGLGLAPTVVAGDPCFHRLDNRPAPTSGATSEVAIGDCVFTPTVTRVAVGTTVTWKNSSGQAHEVVGSNMTWGAHDKLLQPGDSIGWTFANPGVYGYSCMLHPGMTGTVIVGEPVTAAAAAGGENAALARSAGGPEDAVPSAARTALAAAGGVVLGVVVASLISRRRRPANPIS